MADPALGRDVGRGRQVLVVEDDAAVRTLVQRVLTAYGFKVRLATDGLEGLMALERELPDLVIADIMMPRLDGMSFVKAIRGRDETKRIPVIFLTAKSDAPTMIDAINAGARFYLTKPFQIEDLVGKVEKALGSVA